MSTISAPSDKAKNIIYAFLLTYVAIDLCLSLLSGKRYISLPEMLYANINQPVTWVIIAVGAIIGLIGYVWWSI